MISKVHKRVGIFTFHRALNYGAIWQCYALKKVCELLGCKVETIDFNPFGDYNVLGLLRHHPIVAYTYIARMFHFNRFVKNRLNPTIHTESHEWIKNNPPLEDIYIVGSDQVWSTKIVGEQLDSYLLDFAPPQVKRIAYAVSTGGNSLGLNEYQLTELRKFNAISVREKQSVQNIQKKVDIPVFDVCDPTLLLTSKDYESLEQKPICLPKHYVAYFNLAGSAFCEESAKILSRQLGLPIVNMVGKYKSWAKRNYPAPTPEQWLYIIHHADFVCTNSFHGACFSLISHRPFIYCGAKEGERVKLNDRVTNLLEQTGLQERFVTEPSQVFELSVEGGGFEDKDKFISQYRDRSLEWLRAALEYNN